MSNHSNNPQALSLSAKARRTTEQPISFLMAAAIGRKDLISFAAGLVDEPSLPVDEVRDITARLFADPARARSVLQYDTTHGLLPLRKLLLSHLEHLEGHSSEALSLTPADVLITTGSQQALYLIADTLLDPGDIVIAEAPSYFVYTGTLTSFGAQVLTVPMDQHGMDVDAVEQLLIRLENQGKLPRVKLIYCMSYYQNPTGLSLSLPRRKKLLELAKRFSKSHRILILEDAAYRELYFEGESLPSIKSFDSANQYTILAQTFSKPFAPGIKTGYAILPADLVDPILQQKGNHDFGSPNLCQNIAYETMKDGSYAKHLVHLNAAYKHKRDLMLAALDKYMPKHDGISWIHPQGGIYVWLTLPTSIDTSRESHMFQQSVKQGVIYVPGAYAYSPDESGHTPKNSLRLCYGIVPEAQIDQGIQRLSQVIAELLQSPPTAVGGHSAIRNPQYT
ncbi:MAG TPA: PLP-dependent aminotransferase family protein [Tepidisphaeraceae bacterium]|jgi:2-aminoadipate transaminase|nr:PLP-dependent aminotransferase family protein [Tepidisphaeraceae bacterium]